MLEGRYLFFMRYLPGFFSTFFFFGGGGGEYGSGRFSGSGADDHQQIFFIWPNLGILYYNLGFTEAVNPHTFTAGYVRALPLYYH